ncbi:MAG: hypothetical protein RLZZ234_641 [Candidatus Parcubacteria bacterium]
MSQKRRPLGGAFLLLILTESVHLSRERSACSPVQGFQLPHKRRVGAFLHALHFVLRPGRELNPRMAVLQTAVLTTSPPGQLVKCTIFVVFSQKTSIVANAPTFLLSSCCCPDGEIGRRARLKILLPVTGSVGSIPTLGTKSRLLPAFSCTEENYVFVWESKSLSISDGTK